MRKVTLLFLALSVNFATLSQVSLNEICAANADILYDTTFFEFGGWVELYNPSDHPVNISGYYLSDDPAIPLKWSIPTNANIPSKGYFLIWCDKTNHWFHTNFKIDPDGDYLRLSNKAGVKLDEVTFGKQYTNVAYGRAANGTTWAYLKNPSPRALNSVSAGTIRLADVEISRDAGKYPSEQSITLQHPKAGAKIYYTLDGSEPTELSTLYNNFPVVISKPTSVKAKAFHKDFLPSKTEVRTYLIVERNFTLPVVALSIDPRYLNNDTIGIHVQGTNGAVGSGTDYPVNFNQDWYRHVDFEYFKPDGEKVFGQSFDMRIYGNFSRRKPQKSFAFKARDKYGKTTIDHKLFPLKNHYSYGGFVLRNSGTDWSVTHFRDALMQRFTVGQMDLDFLDYQPTTVYLNGEYWGILNLREKNDEDYFKTNFGISREDLDYLEGNSTIEAGDRVAYNIYVDSLERISRGEPKTIDFVNRHIDLKNYLNYMVHNIYIVNTDWPGNNLKYWKQRSNNGKFRWLLWDNDFGFGGVRTQGDWNHLTLDYVTNPASQEGKNKPWSTQNLRWLLENSTFKRRFISTALTAMQITYEPDRVLKIINEFAATIDEEMVHHKTKWGGKQEDWLAQIDRLREFATLRHDFFKDHLIDFFDLTEEVRFNIRATPANGGQYELNGVKTTKELKNGLYFNSIPFNVTAIPKGGYKFRKWTIFKRDHTEFASIPKQSVWKYFDKGTLPSADWHKQSYSDNTWSSGQGQLGYGEGDEKTVISYGPSSSNKYTTAYFRKQFNIADIEKIEDVRASLNFDDGAIVYVNGTEVLRLNMPAGDISFSTFSSTTISAAQTVVFAIDKSSLVSGTNTVAVEIHQGTLTSSDLSFEFSMTCTEIGDFRQTETTSPTVEGIAFSDVTLEAIFEQYNGIVINEFSAANSQLKDEYDEADDWVELYNSGSQAFDIAGLYITDDLNNKVKYKIPAGKPETLMQPGDYLLLWADGQPDQGATHLNFKLADEGEAIGLYISENGQLQKLDEIVFGMQMTDQSWSRVPNATGPFGITTYTTPMEENTSVLGVGENENYTISAFPNPTAGILHLIFDSGKNDVALYDLCGRKAKNFGMLSNEAQIDLNDLPGGIYILKVTSGKKSGFTRIMKR